MKMIVCKYFPPSYIINLFGVIFVRQSGLLRKYISTCTGLKTHLEMRADFEKYWLSVPKNVLMIIGKDVLNEEAIHTKQMKWLGYIPFYILYLIFFLLYYVVTGFSFRKGYEAIPFEKEAKIDNGDFTYTETRKKYG